MKHKVQKNQWEKPDLLRASCKWNGEILHFDISQKLPMTKKHNEYLRNQWVGSIIQAYQNLNNHIFFSKAMCVIRITDFETTYWDVDNRSVKYVVDAVRATGIIKDDNQDNLTITVTGSTGKNRTEIFLFDHKLYDRFFTKLLNQCN